MPQSDLAFPAADCAAIALIVLDIDGTIAGESNEIRPAVFEAVAEAKAAGIQIAIATGRMYRSARRFYEALELTLPLMVYQGAWIQDMQADRRLYHQPMPIEPAAEILTMLEDPIYADLSVHLYCDDRLYVRAAHGATVDYASRSGIPLEVMPDLRPLLDQEPTKLLVLGESPALITSLGEALQARFAPTDLYLTQSTDTFVEAAHPLVNKGNAVRYLAEDRLGLQAHQVMTIGDNFNDVEMLQYAGLGVAMGDGPAAVQAQANWVTFGVEEDGAARAIAAVLARRLV
jgi:Cof subfamily protein (haloacid dehalogenase superfamily)